MAFVHQMILRYITFYFASLQLNKISLLKYEQFIIILKHHHLFAPNEDTVLEAFEHWVAGNDSFKINAIEQEMSGESSDMGKSLKQL